GQRPAGARRHRRRPARFGQCQDLVLGRHRTGDHRPAVGDLQLDPGRRRDPVAADHGTGAVGAVIALKPLHLAGLTTAAIAAVAGFWLLRNFDPGAAHSPFPECMFRAFTGWYCVGCGMTRALHALAHGDVPRAFSMNPLAMTLLAISPLLLGWKLGWQPGWLRPLVAVVA